MISFLQSHWSVLALPAFTVASLSLNFIASVFVALGKSAPGWVGDGSAFVGKVLHFLNGNPLVLQAPAPKPPSA